MHERRWLSWFFKISPTLRSFAAAVGFITSAPFNTQSLVNKPRGLHIPQTLEAIWSYSSRPRAWSAGEHGAKEILRTFLHQGMKDVPWQLPKIKVPSNQVMRSWGYIDFGTRCAVDLRIAKPLHSVRLFVKKTNKILANAFQAARELCHSQTQSDMHQLHSDPPASEPQNSMRMQCGTEHLTIGKRGQKHQSQVAPIKSDPPNGRLLDSLQWSMSVVKSKPINLFSQEPVCHICSPIPPSIIKLLLHWILSKMLLTNVSKTFSIHTKGFLQSILHATLWIRLFSQTSIPVAVLIHRLGLRHHRVQISSPGIKWRDGDPLFCVCCPLCIFAVNFLKLGCCLVSIENLVLSLWLLLLLLLLTVARFAIIGYLCCSHFCSASCCFVLLLLLSAVRPCLSPCQTVFNACCSSTSSFNWRFAKQRSNFTCLHATSMNTICIHFPALIHQCTICRFWSGYSFSSPLVFGQLFQLRSPVVVWHRHLHAFAVYHCVSAVHPMASQRIRQTRSALKASATVYSTKPPEPKLFNSSPAWATCGATTGDRRPPNLARI